MLLFHRKEEECPDVIHCDLLSTEEMLVSPTHVHRDLLLLDAITRAETSDSAKNAPFCVYYSAVRIGSLTSSNRLLLTDAILTWMIISFYFLR